VGHWDGNDVLGGI
jgi:hypothetical protein